MGTPKMVNKSKCKFYHDRRNHLVEKSYTKGGRRLSPKLGVNGRSLFKFIYRKAAKIPEEYVMANKLD